MAALPLVPMLLFLLACPPKLDSDTGPTPFASGNFRFTVEKVNDTCMNGAWAEAWFGTSFPMDLDQPLLVPAEADLPASYSVLLPSPLGNLSVTTDVGAASGTLETHATYPGFRPDSTNYSGCSVDLDITVYLTETSADDLEGTATLRLGPFPTDGCPAVAKDPCDILIDLVAHRL